jgi:undecaprenyl phosphate N,N'-diacetylbacillosamine 1-phosphate transferase
VGGWCFRAVCTVTRVSIKGFSEARMYRHFLKRFADIVISVAVIAVTSPILIITFAPLAIAGSPFFYQSRVGRDGRLFRIIKFRTMTIKDREAEKQVMSGDSEVTRLGSVMRRFKIDELPQIFNVLVGQMSIVGPRPCLPSLVESFNDDGRARLKVRPGLTGLAQVNGNIHLSWEERWKYDKTYVESLSLSTDLVIILKTILVVLLGEDRFVSRPQQ